MVYSQFMKQQWDSRIPFEEIPAFFAREGLLYRPRSRVEAPEVLSYPWASSPYALANQAEWAVLTKKYGQKLEAGLGAQVSLGWVSESVGWGVFAEHDLPEGDLVGEYAGVVRRATEVPPVKDEKGHYLSDYAWNYPDELPDGTEFEIDAYREGNALRFVNHSFTPNCAVDHTLVGGIFVTFFRTLQLIKAGEQLFVDYGEEYWAEGFRTLESL